jgi:hypothetical protein
MVPSFDLDPLTSIVARYWGHFMRKTHFVHRPIFAQNLGDNIDSKSIGKTLKVNQGSQWTSTVETPNGVLNYDRNTGTGSVEWYDKLGKRQVTNYPDDHGRPGFSQGWTKIVNTSNGILFYNAYTGSAVIGRIDEGNYHDITKISNFPIGCANLENTPEGIQCYNPNTGISSVIGQIDSDGSFMPIK